MKVYETIRKVNMKSYNHLFEKLISEENLKKAVFRSAKKKLKRKDVQEVIQNKDKYIKMLQECLTNQTYRIRKHKARLIIDGKPRIVIQPDYIQEQILHHAVVQILRPIFEKGMYEFSCGSIPNRGAHHGKQHIENYIRNNKRNIKYFLKLDIHHFFQSIDVELLRAKFKKVIHDDKMLYVINLVLDANKAYYNNELIDMGLPIGFYPSQWFANWFLQDFDHFVVEKLKAKCYTRYVDDMLVFSSNKKELRYILEEMRKYLASKKLTIKANWQIARFDYISLANGKRKGRPANFIGFKFYREKTVLRKSILYKAIRKVVRLRKKGNCTWYDACQILSYMGWFKCTDTYNVYLHRIKPYISIKYCKQKVSSRQKLINKETLNDIMAK